MKFYALLSNLIFLTKETATAVGGGNHPIVNLFNWALDWTVIIVVPAGNLSLIINSIINQQEEKFIFGLYFLWQLV